MSHSASYDQTRCCLAIVASLCLVHVFGTYSAVGYKVSDHVPHALSALTTLPPLLARNKMNAAPVKYAIQAVPGKGQGMVATAAINRGELIIAEPSIIEPEIGPDVLYSPDDFFDPASDYPGVTIQGLPSKSSL